ncbi:MAG: hypothetical protein ACM3ML_37855 [Micromonosporaceae bacterium]
MAQSGGSWFGPGDTRDDVPRGVPIPSTGDEDAALAPRPVEHHGPPLVSIPMEHGAGGYDRVHHGDDDEEALIGLPEVIGWVWRKRVLLGGLVLIAAAIVWKALFLNHFFFWEDDYRHLDHALDSPFNWKYLGSMKLELGHLMPGPYAIAWAVARLGLYDWALATGVTLVLVAAAGLAALRLLRTVFGDRPAILIPLTVYLLTPLTMPTISWWSSAIETLPLQVATFMALTAHVHYLRTRNLWHAAAAGVWLAIGMFFFEKGVVLPLLLFAVTSAFFVGGRWLTAIRRAAMDHWRAWLLYVAVLGGYVAIFLAQLHTSTVKPGSPGPYRGVLTFISTLLGKTFIPGALGGPWQWFPTGNVAASASAPPTVLLWVSWIVAAGVIVASIWNRKYAWRAWAILAGWIAVADMMPVLIGRIQLEGASWAGVETRYVADAAPVLVICLGFAFLPVVGRRDSRRARREPVLTSGQLTSAATPAVLGAFIVGSLWSVQAYQNATTSAPARDYITNARAALAAAPYGTVIVDQQVPLSLIAPQFGQYAYASKVVGEMVRGTSPSQLKWTKRPYGTLDSLLAFGFDGRLHQATVVGAASRPLPTGTGCWPARVPGGRKMVVQLTAPATNVTTLRIPYFSYVHSAKAVTVKYAGQSQPLILKPGLHNAYLPVRGVASSFSVIGLTAKQLCVGSAVAGALFPASSGPVIPATPARG